MVYDNLVIEGVHPALPGHFPGNPVAPSVVLLQMVIDALAAGQPSRIVTGVRQIMFLLPVRPDEAFRIEYSDVREGCFQVRTQAGDVLLAEGRLRMAPAPVGA